MAGKYLQISKPSFPSTLIPPPSLHRRPAPLLTLPVPPHAASSPEDDKDSKTADDSSPSADAVFEKRLSQVRLKYRIGSGKKAEQRKARKSSAGGGGGGGKKKGSVMLPPVPLREPVAAGGVPVEVGFTPYSERLNGRLAGLGLAALLLVELGSGQGLFRYHAPPVIFIQIYTVAAAAAVFVKYEKERISIWPEKSTSPPSDTASGE